MGVRKKLLLIGPLPPPLAGPEMVTLTFTESEMLREKYVITHINTTVRQSNDVKGKLDIVMILAFVSYLYRLIYQLIITRPDYILYCPTSATLKGWVRDGMTLLIGGFSRARIFMLFQGGHFRYFHDSLGKRPRGIIRWLLNRAHRVLVQADILKFQFEGIVPDAKIATLHNFIGDKFYASFDNVNRERETPEVNILFIGHLSFAKGYCDLLKTVPVLSRKHDVKFMIMGARTGVERNVFYNQVTGERITPEQPDDVYREYIVGQGLEDSVVFLGDKVFGEDKLRIFRDADIFVLPSYSESFSMSLLEAMAAGLPVVVTGVGAVPEIIDDGTIGYIIQPSDTGMLADRLESLISDAALRLEMGRKSRDLCRERFLDNAGSRNLVTLLENQ